MTRILIAGGYGQVGGTVARLLRGTHPDAELVLAGRNPESGISLARELGNARTARLDLADVDFASVGPVDLVVAAVYDPANALLQAAIAHGAAFIGITTTAENLAPAAFAALRASRPVVLLGYAAAGVPAIAAREALASFASVESIAMTALYDLRDPVGPMTAGDAEYLVASGLVREAGNWIWVKDAPPRAIEIDGMTVHGLPTSLLDVPGLAAVSGVPNIRLDMAQGDSRGTRSGAAASSDTYIDIDGMHVDGRRGRTRTVVSDPRGLIHLTALGVVIAAERVLDLDGAGPVAGGLQLPETLLAPDTALTRLRTFGVDIATV